MGANQFGENSLTGHTVPPICGVYRVTDTLTGVVYVGASNNIRHRVSTHFSELARKSKKAPYRAFSATYAAAGTKAFTVDVLEVCTHDVLFERELHWLLKLKPSGNTMHVAEAGMAFTEEERMKRAERTRGLWADPVYRERAVAARKGKTYAKGFKCNPEQVENRKRAGRISNMRRNYGGDWKKEYVSRYPEYAGDVDGE